MLLDSVELLRKGGEKRKNKKAKFKKDFSREDNQFVSRDFFYLINSTVSLSSSPLTFILSP